MKKRMYAMNMIMLLIVIVFTGCNSVKNQTSDNGTQSSATITLSASQTPNNVTAAPSINETPVAKRFEAPVAPEKNPPGDIPDTQVFIKYSSATAGYQLQVPEGWARTENGASVKFTDKFDGVSVDISDVTYSLSVDSINKNFIPALKATGRAITVNSIKAVKLSGGKAINISYSSNSEPDSVTNKQIRLENESTIFIKNGKMSVLTTWAPLGADNVDQWNLMKNSFKLK